MSVALQPNLLYLNTLQMMQFILEQKSLTYQFKPLFN